MGADQRLTVAILAARAAGDLLRRGFRSDRLRVNVKTAGRDLVTQLDTQCESVIRQLINSHNPDDSILGEEEGQSEGRGMRWVIDPLDGTANFVDGIPHFAVSIACEDQLGGLVGVIYDPFHEEMFTAVRGEGAYLNGQRLPEHSGRALERSLAFAHFSCRLPSAAHIQQLTVQSRLFQRVGQVGMLVSTAVALAWLATGRADLYYQRGAKRWDYAAGLLLCSEVGLDVRFLPARDALRPGILVGHSEMIDPLVSLL